MLLIPLRKVKPVGIVWCRGFAKRTLLKTARKAGIKTKDASSSGKRQKYNLTMATPPMMRRSAGGTLPNSDTLTSDAGMPVFDDDLSGLCLRLFCGYSNYYTLEYDSCSSK